MWQQSVAVAYTSNISLRSGKYNSREEFKSKHEDTHW